MALRVLYSCPDCGLRDAACNVPERQEWEPVVEWMEETILHVSADHARRSPTCHPKELKDLKIPVGDENDPNTRIGAAVKRGLGGDDGKSE